jgi:hypothetical protein
MEYTLQVKRGVGTMGPRVTIEAAYDGSSSRSALEKLDSAYREAREKILGTVAAPQRDTRTY